MGWAIQAGVRAYQADRSEIGCIPTVDPQDCHGERCTAQAVPTQDVVQHGPETFHGGSVWAHSSAMGVGSN